MRKGAAGRERGVRGRCDRDMIAAGAGAGAEREGSFVEITFILKADSRK